MTSDDDPDESSRLEIRIPSDDDPEEICDILDICKTDQGMDILQKLNDRRKTSKHCDVIIKVCKEEIRANKAVLTAASDYFDVMFSHDTKESQSGIVELREMEPVSVKKCIDFIYTGKLSMDKKEWEDVLYVASMMQLSAVCEEIEVFLRKSLRANNFFRIKKLAARYDVEQLNEFCDEYAVKNLKLIMEEPDFGTVEFGYVVFLLSPQKQDSVDEVFKMNLLLKWAKFDVENHQKDFSKICDVVDVQKLPLSFCRNLVESEPLCYRCAEFMRTVYLMEVNKPKRELSTGTQTSVDMSDRSTCTDVVLHDASLLRYASEADSSTTNAIILLSTEEECLLSYQPSTGCWYKESKLHHVMHNQHFYTAVVVGNCLYVLLHNRNFYRISFTDDIGWEELDKCPYAFKQHPNAAVCNEVLYITGGKRMACFNIAELKWENFDKGPAESAHSTLVECDDCIYSIGGGNQHKSCSVYEYRPICRMWFSVACMNVARDTPAAVSHLRDIYVAGGYDDDYLSSAECYSPLEDAWTLLSPMKTARRYFTLVVADGKIFTVGSSGSEVYDVEKDEWHELAGMPSYKGCAIATVKVSTI